MARLMRSGNVKIAISLLVSLGLLIWLGLGLDWDAVWRAMRQSHLGYLIPLSLLLVLQVAVRAWRWRYFFVGQPKPTFRALFSSLSIGNFATFVLPLRAGEFIRPFSLSLMSKQSFVTGFSSVILERFFDLSAVLLCFGVVVARLPGLPDWVAKGAIGLICVAFGIFGLIVVGAFRPKFLKDFIHVVVKPLPLRLAGKIQHHADDFVAALAAVAEITNLANALVLTLVSWALGYLYFYLAMPMFDLSASWQIAVTTGVVIALAVAAPSAPGFLGVYQTGFVAAFALFGLPKEQAFAIAVVAHVHQYIFFILVGLLAMLFEGLSFKTLRTKSA